MPFSRIKCFTAAAFAAALLFLAPALHSADPVQTVALDNPAVRYVLEHTAEGRSLLNSLQPAVPGASAETRITRLIRQVEGAPDAPIARKLVKLSDGRFVTGVSPQAPLRDWDRVMLRHVVQDILKHQANPDGGVIFDDLKTIPKGTRPGAKHLSEDHRRWVQSYDEWVKWADREKELATAERGTKLLDEARTTFGGLGINYSELTLRDGTPALKIEPGRGNRLNLLAGGLQENLDRTLLAYAPQRLIQDGINGAFIPGERTVLMSHISVLELRSDETMLHEIVHAKFRDELNRGRVTHFHGSLRNTSDAAFKARFSYMKSGRMSFEEVATFAMGLHNSAERLKRVAEMSDEEIRWAINRMARYARQGENASVYARGVLSEALERMKLNPEIVEFHKVKRAHATVPEAVLRFGMPEIGQDFEIQVPLRDEAGLTKKALEQELKARIGLFQEMQDSYREVGQVVGSLDGTPQALERLAKAARGPRVVSLPYVRGISWAGPGCLQHALAQGVGQAAVK